jgi:hypothetical protein
MSASMIAFGLGTMFGGWIGALVVAIFASRKPDQTSRVQGPLTPPMDPNDVKDWDAI